MKAILVHGIWDDASIFRSLVGTLEAHGHSCFAPSLKPSDGRLGLVNLAEKLAAAINQNLQPNDRFLLVGFSMGCLISRAYLQLLGGRQRCVAFHAISGPHHGSFWAYFYPGLGARDMRPKSDLLRQLEATEKVLADLPITSYRTPFDLMILPSRSSHWDLATNIQTNCPIHALMVKNPVVQQSVLDALIRIDPHAELPSSAPDMNPHVI